ncbi:MAG: hypothetical protein QOJ64_4224 [Acidobacteriota bacterium]|jgi:5-hydroxyisourate hydrolase-like protein (transthyretin family)|nr:hypothetical protein [Acidobacteriota bacterium]
MTKITTLLLFLVLALSGVAASAQDKSVGGIKGKVRLKGEGPVAGVQVSLRQKERELAHVNTNGKGEFQLKNLTPGTYGLTFHKEGLSMGTLEGVIVKPGKTNELSDRLILTINESAVAKLGGSVFNPGGLSVPNVRIELARIKSDGRARRIDARITNESGQFVFRLSPEKAMYRVTAKPDGAEAQSKDVEVDGAMIYRVAFTIERPPK